MYESQSGLVVPSGDYDALESAIRRLHRDRLMGERMGANGRRYAEKEFDRKRALARFEKLIVGCGGTKSA